MSTSHTDDHIDRLGEMFELQGDLQRNTYGSHPADITDPAERIQFFKDMHIAITDELHEALAEMGWKPWATSKHFNEDAVQGELVDAFHFFMNLAMAAKMTPDILFERYKAKRLKNIQRQKDGYDGVTTKCRMCGKAFDDDAVTCHAPSGEYPDGWCGGPTNVVDPNWDYDENRPLAPEDRGVSDDQKCEVCGQTYEDGPCEPDPKHPGWSFCGNKKSFGFPA